MTNGDPPRLKTDRAGDPELLRALRALGAEAAQEDSERMARVSQRLGGLLDAPVPSSQQSWSRYARYKSLFARWLLFGAALGVPVLWYLRSQPAVPLPVAAPARLAAPAAAPPVTPPSAAVSELPLTAARAEPPPAAVPVITPASKAAAPRRLRSRMPASVAKSVASAAQVAATVDTGPAAAPLPAPPVAEAEDKKPTELAAQPPRPSETALLFEARKAIRTQPQRALGILQDHAAFYPRGLLAPEREVLSIEALRQLGRVKEADERLQKFRTQYPDSLHLRRLRP
ncbi:MAG: hypothetical protein RL701_7789 [Pseudomonadota bacterium]|jgi:hypothetical protein